MPKKFMPKAHALAGAFDHAWDVGHNKRTALAHAYYPQHRGKGCKVIIGDFGLGLADDRKQGGFTDIGIA